MREGRSDRDRTDETDRDGPLAKLMRGRARKLAGFRRAVNPPGYRAAVSQPGRLSTSRGDSPLRSFERPSTNQGEALTDLVALMRRRLTAQGRLRTGSPVIRTGGHPTREISLESLIRSEAGRKDNSAESGRALSGTGALIRGRGARRHAPAITRARGQSGAVEYEVGERRESRREAVNLVPGNKWLRALKLESYTGPKPGTFRSKVAPAGIESAAYSSSSIGKLNRLARNYRASRDLGQTSPLRSRGTLSSVRPGQAKSSRGAQRIGRSLAAEPGLASSDAGEQRSIKANTDSSRKQRTPLSQQRSQSALTVNFNPTVVVKGESSHAAKQNIIEALSRHSHELVQLIEHEIAKQRRVEFLS